MKPKQGNNTLQLTQRSVEAGYAEPTPLDLTRSPNLLPPSGKRQDGPAVFAMFQRLNPHIIPQFGKMDQAHLTIPLLFRTQQKNGHGLFAPGFSGATLARGDGGDLGWQCFWHCESVCMARLGPGVGGQVHWCLSYHLVYYQMASAEASDVIARWSVLLSIPVFPGDIADNQERELPNRQAGG